MKGFLNINEAMDKVGVNKVKVRTQDSGGSTNGTRQVNSSSQHSNRKKTITNGDSITAIITTSNKKAEPQPRFDIKRANNNSATKY